MAVPYPFPVLQNPYIATTSSTAPTSRPATTALKSPTISTVSTLSVATTSSAETTDPTGVISEAASSEPSVDRDALIREVREILFLSAIQKLETKLLTQHLRNQSRMDIKRQIEFLRKQLNYENI
jgi:hypothetical protein